MPRFKVTRGVKQVDLGERVPKRQREAVRSIVRDLLKDNSDITSDLNKLGLSIRLCFDTNKYVHKHGRQYIVRLPDEPAEPKPKVFKTRVAAAQHRNNVMCRLHMLYSVPQLRRIPGAIIGGE